MFGEIWGKIKYVIASKKAFKLESESMFADALKVRLSIPSFCKNVPVSYYFDLARVTVLEGKCSKEVLSQALEIVQEGLNLHKDRAERFIKRNNVDEYNYVLMIGYIMMFRDLMDLRKYNEAKNIAEYLSNVKFDKNKVSRFTQNWFPSDNYDNYIKLKECDYDISRLGWVEIPSEEEA